MDYARFVALRTPGADAFEEALEAAERRPRELGYSDLEQLAFQYRQVLHDHALAAARFPGTAMARRLERLAFRGTHWLQRDSGLHLPTLHRFFTSTFPRVMRRILPRLALTVALFLAAGLLGMVLTAVEPGLGAAFLNPRAVQDLEAGRLWTESIFAVTPSAVASTRIATNNLSVLVTAWAGGVLLGLGTLYIVLLNGLMLGAVIAFTAHYSMAPSLFEFIAAHGPLEISLILVCAAAGLEVGWALVVAEDRPRSERLREAAKDALVVLLGCMPWILTLGFVEGFVSPSPLVPVPAKALLGLTLEILFVLVAWSPAWRPERAA